jgi:hypothetical protein
MPVFRVVWQYVENTGAQFNEVYYVSASTALAAAQTGSGLATARIALLHPLNKLMKIRSSQVDASRVTASVNYNWNGTAGPLGATDEGPATPGDAIVCALSASPTGQRKIWMRGAPDEYIQRNASSGADFLFPSVRDKLATWFTALKANNYGIRSLSPQSPGPLTNVKITSVATNLLPGTATVTVVTSPGYAIPSRVIIGGASKKDLPALNGRWSLISILDKTFVIPYVVPQGGIVNGGNAYVRKEEYLGVNIFDPASCAFDHFGTRTTKNPITHSRGARRAVRIRTSL